VPISPSILRDQSVWPFPSPPPNCHIQWPAQTGYSFLAQSEEQSVAIHARVNTQRPKRRFDAYLREALLLKVCNDALTHESRRLDNVQNFLVVVTEQSKLEAVLCRIKRDRPRARRPVQAIDSLSFDPGKVNRVVERADDPMVAKNTRSTGERDLNQVGPTLEQGNI